MTEQELPLDSTPAEAAADAAAPAEPARPETVAETVARTLQELNADAGDDQEDGLREPPAPDETVEVSEADDEPEEDLDETDEAEEAPELEALEPMNHWPAEFKDDFASMEEVVFRRYKRLQEEGQSLPQLIIIDGGKGQLSSALKSLDRLELRGKIAIVGIAKRLEEIYFPQDPIPLYLDKKSESLKVIQYLRNEAHRFGITFHRNKRSNGAIRSGLDAIPGVGPKTKENLLKMKWTDTSDKKRPEYSLESAVTKLMMQVDERIAFEQSGIATKKLTALNIQKHLDNFGLEMQFGTYSKISALSGGQKVKVVLAAAMWMEPHVLILDEPTNFLDRDSLGALATAIKSYLGGVIIISHQREFYSALCPEVWSVVDGRCTVSGAEWMDAAEKARKRRARLIEVGAEGQALFGAFPAERADQHRDRLNRGGRAHATPAAPPVRLSSLAIMRRRKRSSPRVRGPALCRIRTL